MRGAALQVVSLDTPCLGPSHTGSGPKKASVNTSRTTSRRLSGVAHRRGSADNGASSANLRRRAARTRSQPFAEYVTVMRERLMMPNRNVGADSARPGGMSMRRCPAHPMPSTHRGPTPFNSGHMYTTFIAGCQEEKGGCGGAGRGKGRAVLRPDRRGCEHPFSQPQSKLWRLTACVHVHYPSPARCRRSDPSRRAVQENGRQRSGKAVTFHHPCLPTAQCLDFSPLKTDHI